MPFQTSNTLQHYYVLTTVQNFMPVDQRISEISLKKIKKKNICSKT